MRWDFGATHFQVGYSVEITTEDEHSTDMDLGGDLICGNPFCDADGSGGAMATNNDTPGFWKLQTTTSGIPEPATWATMLFGCGGLGGALRARRRISETSR